MNHERIYAEKMKQNSILFIQFAQEIANEFTEQHGLNMKIYPYLLMAAQWTGPATTVENFLRVSMKPAAKDRAKYKTLESLPTIEGESRFPYWESVRTRNIQFFIENVEMLLPDIDMKKIASWQDLIPDLQYFTNELMSAEVGKLLGLFRGQFIEEGDVAILWDFFDCFIDHSLKYIHHRRQRESGYLEGFALERELELFRIKLT